MKLIRLLPCLATLLFTSAVQLRSAPGGFDLASYEKPRLAAAAKTVIADEPKTIVTIVNPRSAGGVHDFSSEGDYWWPDPKNPDGPYIQRDGLTNPDNFVGHRQLLLRFVRDFGILSGAYKVTRDESYAAAAVKHLHAWFVDPATKMNPNLLYSQAIKGLYTGRSIGVIDTVHLAEVALGVEALRGSKALNKEEEAAVTGWFREYLTWISTHPYGVGESKADNNHGTCWTLQAACFAHLVGDQKMLAECRTRFKNIHLAKQMAPDGSFPREVARTKPYGYSIFVLDVTAGVAEVLSTPEENLVTFKLPDGRGILKGVEFLAPYIADKNAWLKNVHKPSSTKPELAAATDPLVQPDVMYWNDYPARQPFLVFGGLAANRDDWLDLWKKLDPDPQVEEVRRNMPIRQPVLWVR
jgi:hypothetical protein